MKTINIDDLQRTRQITFGTRVLGRNGNATYTHWEGGTRMFITDGGEWVKGLRSLRKRIG